MASQQRREYDEPLAEPRSIDLRDYWHALRRRWATLLLAAAIGAALALGYATYVGPRYSATAQVLVMPATQGPLNLPAQPNQLVNMTTEQAVAQSGPVIADAAKLLHVSADQLQAQVGSHLSVAVPTLSSVLQISWVGGSPALAANGANAFARAYLMYRKQVLAGQVSHLESVIHGQLQSLQREQSQVSTQLSAAPAGTALHQNLSARLAQLNHQITQAQGELLALPTYDTSGGRVVPASEPLSPTGLSRKVLLIIGGLVGLLLGMIIALVRDALDDDVRDAAQMERALAAPTLAVLPSAKTWLGRGRDRRQSAALVADPAGRAAEAVRALRATLTAVAERDDLCTILVAAADASVSTSRLAAELGTALAESGRRVLLIAADLRGSSLPQIFNVPNTAGLTNYLARRGDAEALIALPKRIGADPLSKSAAGRMAIMPHGPRLADHLSVLDSHHMTGLLNGQRDAFAFILLDSAPAAIADVIALASHVDGVLVAARQSHTRGQALAELRRRLDQVGARVIGGILIAKGRGSQARQSYQPAAGPQPPARRPGNGAVRSAGRVPAGEAHQRRPGGAVQIPPGREPAPPEAVNPIAEQAK